jgi:hypothetical protein
MLASSVTSQWPTTIALEFGRQRLDALLQSIALIGEGQFRTLLGAGLGNAPGNRAVVGHAHDEAALALQKPCSDTVMVPPPVGSLVNNHPLKCS